MQHWELLCPGGLSFVCDDGLFQPSTDSFLLGSFPRLKPGLRVCDLGSGTGLLGLLLFQRQRALSVTGVELLPDAVRLAEQAAARNGLADRLIFRRGDLRKIRGLLPAGGFDLVVCNPPYYPAGSGRLPETEALRAARSETGCTLEDICTAAAWLLRWGGSFCLVHKPERLADLCCALRARGLEPKRLRLVCRRAGDAPSLLLLEARRGGRPGLDIAAPLCLEDGTGRPTAEYFSGQPLLERLESENYIQRFAPLYDGTRLRCGDVLELCRPELAELSSEYAAGDNNVQIIGICTDITDIEGQPVQEGVDLAKQIVELTGASYRHLVPDADLMEFLMQEVAVVPTTYFVDSQGKVVGEATLGARDKASWQQEIDARLAMLEE